MSDSCHSSHILIIISLIIVIIFISQLNLTQLSSSFLSSSSHVKVERPPKEFYYLSTQEGIIAHLRYLQVLSYIANYYNRLIILTPFTSIHYPDLDSVNLCDYFDFPSHIRCTTTSHIDILTSKRCIYTGFSKLNNDSGIPRYIHINRTNDFHYDKIECLAGQVLYTSGHFPRDKISHSQIVDQGFFRIKEKYKVLFFSAKSTLLGNNSVYAVSHWRRGDQLDNRCKMVNGQSINCKTADDMIQEFEKRLKIKAKSNYSEVIFKYVATNEENRTTLSYLQTRGLKLFGDIENGMDIQQLKSLTSVVRFLIDLMLMCDATYYVSWGHTLVFHYVDYCRKTGVF
jgi:hypothetical protein